MPVYDFVNTETGEEWEQTMSYDDMKTLTNDGTVQILYKKINFLHAPGSDGGGISGSYPEKISWLYCAAT